MKKEYFFDEIPYPSDGFSEQIEDEYFDVDEDSADEEALWELPDTQTDGKRKKSPERINREKEFVSLYEKYMHPAESLTAFQAQCLLDDMYLLLCELNMGWVHRRTVRYQSAGFSGVDAEIALSIGTAYVYDLLKQNKTAGKYLTYPVAYYLSVAQRRTIDGYFRKNFGRLPAKKKEAPSAEVKVATEQKPRRKEPYLVSLEGMQTDKEDVYHSDRSVILSCDPFGTTHRPRVEVEDKSRKLSVLYLRELMDYPDEPQKPLALMYGSILFQLAKENSGGDELSKIAQKSSRISSASWAHQRMGKLTLVQLGKASQKIVQRVYHKSLSWGIPFTRHMMELVRDDADKKWADIVYTEAYTEPETSDWIESIFKSTMQKCARRLANDPELREFAIESLGHKNKLRKALEKIEKKGASR